MTATEFGLIRRIEIIGWAQHKFGEHWQSRLAETVGVKRERIVEWMVKGRYGGTALRIEDACRKHGFKGRYDGLFRDYPHHNLIVRDFIARMDSKGFSKGVKLSGEITSTAAALQLVAALGFTAPAP